MKVLFLALFLAVAVASITSVPTKTFLGQSDQVTSLPGLHFKLHFKHYSGYLASANASQLHYWFFESQGDVTKDPVVLWLNGGPGCSSLLGALTENGPIELNADGTLSPNAYAWNSQASILFLESPAGVGFSFNAAKNYSTNDDATAALNYGALQSFYAKFPHLVNNDFYIAGESYGGVYIPTLSRNVVAGGSPANFRGFAIGNGLLEQTMLANSYLLFTHYHGLYSPSMWNSLVSNCCAGVSNTEKCNFVGNTAPACVQSVAAIQNQLNSMPLNPYNIYSSVCKPPQER
ncbi:hypothetical protein TYRP_020567 [Tyrophagus putrescentiae]|nr:hypothetical protein TYRP_020567 [Tyrophagus putrescentiae]